MPLRAVCCHEGTPVLGLNALPTPLIHIEALHHNTSSLSQYPIANSQTAQDHLDHLHLPTLETCQHFLLHFQTEKLLRLFLFQNGTVGCHCPQYYHGTFCELTQAASNSGSGSHSFQIFIYLAIIPLSFALVAMIGAFMCKMCCCDCFEWPYEWHAPCFWKKSRNPDEDPEESMDAEDAEWYRRHCENAYNRAVEAGRAKGSWIGRQQQPTTANSTAAPEHLAPQQQQQLQHNPMPSVSQVPNGGYRGTDARIRNSFDIYPPPYDPPPEYTSTEDLQAAADSARQDC